MNWENILKWCLNCNIDIPYMENDKRLLEKQKEGMNPEPEWEREMWKILDGPLFDLFLLMTGFEKLIVFGTTDLACRIGEKVKQNKITLLCYLEVEPKITDINGTPVISFQDELNYMEADLILVAIYPSEKSDLLMDQISVPSASVSGILGILYPIIKFGAKLWQLMQGRAEAHLFAKYSLNDFAKEAEQVQTFFMEQESAEYIEEVTSFPAVLWKDGVLRHKDCEGNYLNIAGGKRYTTGTPENYQNTVHLFGDCSIFGYGVEDEQTAASLLQAILNRELPETCRVVNHGIQGSNVLHNHTAEQLGSMPVFKEDIFIFLFDSSLYMREYFKLFEEIFSFLGIGFHDTYDEWMALCQTNADEPLYLDDVHLSRYGMKAVADIFARTVLRSETMKQGRCRQINRYIHNLTAVKDNSGGKNGAVVISANPFTNGHRYLIEQACRQVDMLYIFVVEEERFEFPFQERFELVKKGTQDLRNVSVQKSGRYILSAVTFPGYFTKKAKVRNYSDPAYDIELFGTIVAPALQISVRFAGKEPECGVTRQYNQMMRERLLLYGVEFREFERITQEGSPVSASKVRKLFQEQNFMEVSKLVPAVTLEYLALLQDRSERTVY